MYDDEANKFIALRPARPDVGAHCHNRECKTDHVGILHMYIFTKYKRRKVYTQSFCCGLSV